MSNGWDDFKKNFPWRAMTVGFLVPKGILFAGISLNMLFPGALLAVLWCLAVLFTTLLREHKMNIFVPVALVMISLRVVVILASKSPALYLIAQALDSASYGLAFLLSLLFPRSLIQVFAEASGIMIPEAVRDSRYYDIAWRIVSIVWGAAFMLTALVLAILNMNSLKSAAIIDMLASWPLTAVLVAFTVIFPRWYWTKKLGAATVREL